MKVLGGVQGQGELFYLHLVGDLTSAESQEKPSEVAMNGDIVMSEVEDGLGDREVRLLYYYTFTLIASFHILTFCYLLGKEG